MGLSDGPLDRMAGLSDEEKERKMENLKQTRFEKKDYLAIFIALMTTVVPVALVIMAVFALIAGLWLL
ncbi:MAG: hypothetical protein SPL15_07815 [Lachnospiraceae bacterium]|nr:hypothetical protein [Lachnospiraceae bacterium]MDY5742879.1 hypothetical protein [Lachnospiraceae bacterium]